MKRHPVAFLLPGSALLILLVLAAAAEATPHDPIRIEGDDAFCAPGSGVVNCADADGTAERPYVIEGWDITAPLAPEAACGGRAAAGIVLCGTSAHVVVRDVDVEVPWTLPFDTGGLGDTAIPTGVQLVGSGNVLLEDLYIRTRGLAIFVDGAGWPGPGLAPVRVENMALSSASSVTAVELVRTRDAEVHIVDSAVDAAGRNFAFQAAARTREHDIDAHHLLLERVTIDGALLQAVQVQSGRLTILASEIAMASTPRPSNDLESTGLETGAISVLNGAYTEIRDSTITFQGVAVSLNNATALTMRGNQMTGSSAVDVAVELNGDATDLTTPCAFLADFNDFGDLVLVNDLDGCALEAPDNWWGGGGPREDQLRGAIMVPTWAPVNLGQMARVAVTHGPPERVGEYLELQGAVTGPAIGLRLSGDVEAATEVKEGPFAWSVPLRDAPLRALSLRLQACSPEFCGPPVDWVTYHGASSLPPVPVLRAAPLVAAPGEPVLLDASGSYSPAGVPVVRYRFGDGDWQEEPVLQMSWGDPGPYVVDLVVEDADGLRSSEAATVTVRVRNDLPGQSVSARDAPGLGILLLSTSFVLLAASSRRCR